MIQVVENVTLKPVTFDTVKPAQFFKEKQISSTWYMKSSTNHGQYTSNGVKGECRFEPKEIVYIEDI